MEMVHAAIPKTNLEELESTRLDRTCFIRLRGLGQISESREDKLDIEFVGGGRKTILKSTELKVAAPPSPDLTISREKRKPRPKK
jgi:hypothetical protein